MERQHEIVVPFWYWGPPTQPVGLTAEPVHLDELVLQRVQLCSTEHMRKPDVSESTSEMLRMVRHVLERQSARGNQVLYNDSASFISRLR